MKNSEVLILESLAVCVPCEQYGIDLVHRSGGQLGEGSVYRILGDLETAGLVVSRGVLHPGVFTPRLLYRITPAGRLWLSEHAGPPRVHNRHRGTAPFDAVYVGRGTPWGNPVPVGGRISRAASIHRFETEVLPGLDVSMLRGKHLVCSCAPLACHADSILRKANE